MLLLQIIPLEQKERGEMREKKLIKKIFRDTRELVLAKEKEGKVVLQTVYGLAETSFGDLINQPTEGLLYDLNRDRATVLTFINEPKWVNDFACGLVIAKLKTHYDRMICNVCNDLLDEDTKLSHTKEDLIDEYRKGIEDAIGICDEEIKRYSSYATLTEIGEGKIIQSQIIKNKITILLSEQFNNLKRVNVEKWK